jgi:hypothetical protein
MDPQLQQRMMIYGGFVPGAISLVLLAAVWYIHAFKKSREDHLEQELDEDGEPILRRSDGPRWMLPIMLAMGFVGADYAANFTIHLWPDGNNYRFSHAIGLVALVGIIEGLVRLPLLVAFGLRFVAYVGAFWMLAEGYIDTVLGGQTSFVASAGLVGLTAALVATGADRNCEENGTEKSYTWVESISWIVLAGASMPVYLKNSFSIGAMIPAGIIAVMTSTMLLGLIFKDLRLSRGGISVLVGLFVTMLTGSLIQTGVEFLPSVLLVAISPMVMLIPLGDRSGLSRLIIRLVLIGVVMGSAMGSLMMWESEQGSSETEYDPYSDYEE